MARPQLLVFLKAPVPGKVKTRLAKGIGKAAAARAYVAMAKAVRDSAQRVRGVRLVWLYEPAPAFKDLSWLAPARGELRRQAPGDLGARLRAAFAEAFERGASALCAIGTDSPELSPRTIERAFRALRRGDAVLGPSEDGGYYLIGLRRPQPALFEGIPWSGPRVLEATLHQGRRLRLGIGLLARHYDVDDARGLLRWLRPRS